MSKVVGSACSRTKLNRSVPRALCFFAVTLVCADDENLKKQIDTTVLAKATVNSGHGSTMADVHYHLRRDREHVCCCCFSFSRASRAVVAFENLAAAL